MDRTLFCDVQYDHLETYVSSYHREEISGLLINIYLILGGYLYDLSSNR